MKKLTKAELLALWKKHKNLRITLKAGTFSRYRYLSKGSPVKYRYIDAGGKPRISCFEHHGGFFDGKVLKADMKLSLGRMFRYDQVNRFPQPYISEVRVGRKKVWSIKK
jgi:hypothetical protein